MAYYGMQESNLPSEDGKRVIFPRLKLSGQTTIDDIAESISTASTFTPGEIKGLVQSLTEEIAKAMANGYSVKIEGLGIFTPAIGLRKGVERDEDEDGLHHNAASLCVNAVRFKADKALITETDKYCELERAPEEFKQSSQAHTEEERLKMAKEYLEKNPFITVDEYCSLTGLLRYAASRELKQWSANPETGITSTGRATHKVYVKR